MSNSILALIIFLPILLVGIPFLITLILENTLEVGFFYFIELIITKDLFHFIYKKRLVKGDLVIVRFRGKFRKAYIKDKCWNNTVQLEFEENNLNIPLTIGTYWPLSRIMLPEYLGRSAKILFNERE